MTINTMTRKIAAGTAAILIFAGAGTASAQEVQVAFQAHELTTEGGVRAVADRIEGNVRRACRRTSWHSAPSARRDCREDLTGQIVGQIGNPELTAMFFGPSSDRYASLGRSGSE